MYKLGQELRLNDGSLIRINRTINATTYEFTILQTGKQLIDEILSRTKASNYGGAPAHVTEDALRDKASTWIASVLQDNQKERHHARRH